MLYCRFCPANWQIFKDGGESPPLLPFLSFVPVLPLLEKAFVMTAVEFFDVFDMGLNASQMRDYIVVI